MTGPPRLDDAPTIAEPPAQIDPEPPPSRGLGWGMLLGALVVVAAAAIAAAAYFMTRDDSNGAQTTTAPTTTVTAAAGRVFVPDVTGLRQAEAASRLGEKQLVPAVRYRATAKPDGLVVEQRPEAAAQVKRGTKVTLVVDRGAPAVAIPDLVGLKVAAAGSRLAKAGLKAQTTPVTSSASQPGTVVSQSPAAGAKAKRGSVVTLSVARAQPAPPPATTTATTTTATTAPASATVPDVGGGDLRAASHALYDAGVRASVRYVPSQTPLEAVVAQSPDPGTTVRARSRVTVNVSAGPGDKPAKTVPDVVGQELRQAVATLNGAGLRLIFVKVPAPSPAQVGKVVAQTPSAAASAPPKAQVLVELGVRR
jgi:beta-lactam-binding protein with PASTA domain